jgi:putative tryptophan/tyrosine transport system substrate-binding protein
MTIIYFKLNSAARFFACAMALITPMAKFGVRLGAVFLLANYLFTFTLVWAAAPDNVAIVVSENADAYTQVAERLRVRFELENPERARFITIPAQALEGKNAEALANYQLVVSVGVRAATLINNMDLRTPVLHTLIPRSAYEQLLLARPANKNVSAVFIDQPVIRQLELIRLSAPQVDRVGSLLGNDSSASARALEQSARLLGLQMELEVLKAPDELPSALKRTLARSDALLALPDVQVYNQSTLQGILLNAYRSGAPVFGFSAAQVKAGALAAVYSTPEQIGSYAGEILLKAGEGNKWTLPVAQYPRYFNVAVNREVSRSLGLQIDEDIVLQEKLKRTARTE